MTEKKFYVIEHDGRISIEKEVPKGGYKLDEVRIEEDSLLSSVFDPDGKKAIMELAFLEDVLTKVYVQGCYDGLADGDKDPEPE